MVLDPALSDAEGEPANSVNTTGVAEDAGDYDMADETLGDIGPQAGSQESHETYSISNGSTTSSEAPVVVTSQRAPLKKAGSVASGSKRREHLANLPSSDIGEASSMDDSMTLMDSKGRQEARLSSPVLPPSSQPIEAAARQAARPTSMFTPRAKDTSDRPSSNFTVEVPLRSATKPTPPQPVLRKARTSSSSSSEVAEVVVASQPEKSLIVKDSSSSSELSDVDTPSSTANPGSATRPKPQGRRSLYKELEERVMEMPTDEEQSTDVDKDLDKDEYDPSSSSTNKRATSKGKGRPSAVYGKSKGRKSKDQASTTTRSRKSATPSQKKRQTSSPPSEAGTEKVASEEEEEDELESDDSTFVIKSARPTAKRKSTGGKSSNSKTASPKPANGKAKKATQSRRPAASQSLQSISVQYDDDDDDDDLPMMPGLPLSQSMPSLSQTDGPDKWIHMLGPRVWVAIKAKPKVDMIGEELLEGDGQPVDDDAPHFWWPCHKHRTAVINFRVKPFLDTPDQEILTYTYGAFPHLPSLK